MSVYPNPHSIHSVLQWCKEAKASGDIADFAVINTPDGKAILARPHGEPRFNPDPVWREFEPAYDPSFDL